MDFIKIPTEPDQAYWLLKDRHQVFWLDSALANSKFSNFSFIGCEPKMGFQINSPDEAVIETYKDCMVCQTQVWQEPFSKLEDLIAQRRHEFEAQWSQAHEGIQKQLKSIPFCGGALGYFSYDLKGAIEDLPNSAVNDLPIPLAKLHFYDWVYAYNHQENMGYIVSYKPEVDLAYWEDILLGTPQIHCDSGPFVSGPLQSNMTRDQYNGGLEAIKTHIANGDIYQINFTQRFCAPFKGDVVSLYYTLRRANPAPFASFLRYGDFDIMSCSPERFIKLEDGTLETRPIKGTIARGKTEEADQENKDWLANSFKDRSELLMIVDLERNDLSKIAARGSVSVPELFALETYPTVFHLVSTVRAKLAPNKGPVDVLKATFPGGSITGTPKIKAMSVIDTLEPTCRNLYTGSIGYIDDSGTMDLNIVIRTLVRQNKGEGENSPPSPVIHYQVGGGIVWDSITDSEYEESLTKGLALKRVLYNDQTIEF